MAIGLVPVVAVPLVIASYFRILVLDCFPRYQRAAKSSILHFPIVPVDYQTR